MSNWRDHSDGLHGSCTSDGARMWTHVDDGSCRAMATRVRPHAVRFDPTPLVRQVALDMRNEMPNYPHQTVEYGPTSQRIAEVLGVTDRTVKRWKTGVTISRNMADTLAVRIGLVPEMLWDEWNQ